MTAQRLSRIAAGIAIVTVLGVTALVTRNVLWPDDPDASLQRNGGKVMGDMAGYVGRVDREARTVDISTSPLGIRPVVLLVTNETAIVVNGKQGAIGDLWKDLPVRVLYEVRDNARYATSIQVTAGDSLAASPAAKDRPGLGDSDTDEGATGAFRRDEPSPGNRAAARCPRARRSGNASQASGAASRRDEAYAGRTGTCAGRAAASSGHGPASGCRGAPGAGRAAASGGHGPASGCRGAPGTGRAAPGAEGCGAGGPEGPGRGDAVDAFG